jgi:electron transport complex protein RnfG
LKVVIKIKTRSRASFSRAPLSRGVGSALVGAVATLAVAGASAVGQADAVAGPGAVSSPAAPAAGAAAGAEASYFSSRAVLAEFFPRSERVTYRTFALDAATRTRLARRLGYAPARDRYTVFVALTHDRVDGYAVIDDEQGLHQPITFATRLSPRGVVERMEIMVYREARGDEVRDPRFRAQFVGKTSRDRLRINGDLDAVSGATVSSASLATGVRRALILVEELVLGGAGAPSTATATATVPEITAPLATATR